MLKTTSSICQEMSNTFVVIKWDTFFNLGVETHGLITTV